MCFFFLVGLEVVALVILGQSLFPLSFMDIEVVSHYPKVVVTFHSDRRCKEKPFFCISFMCDSILVDRLGKPKTVYLNKMKVMYIYLVLEKLTNYTRSSLGAQILQGLFNRVPSYILTFSGLGMYELYFDDVQTVYGCPYCGYLTINGRCRCVNTGQTHPDMAELMYLMLLDCIMYPFEKGNWFKITACITFTHTSCERFILFIFIDRDRKRVTVFCHDKLMKYTVHGNKMYHYIQIRNKTMYETVMKVLDTFMVNLGVVKVETLQCLAIAEVSRCILDKSSEDFTQNSMRLPWTLQKRVYSNVLNIP